MTNQKIQRLSPGMIRVGLTASIPLHVRDWSLDPEPIIRADGFERSAFEDPDRPVFYAGLVQLLNSAAVATKCEHFGLRVGEAADLETLGRLGDEMRKSRSIRAALELLQSGYSTFDRGAVLTISLGADVVDVCYVIIEPKVTSIAHAGDVVASAGCKILRDLCGDEWKPSSIRLPRRRPLNEAPYRSAFNCAIAYNQLATSIQFPSCWLARPVHSPLEGGALGFAPEDSTSLIEHIASICITNLLAGRVPSSKSAAREVAVSERTLLRRLEEHGQSFSSVFARTRRLAAVRLLNDTNVSLKDISHALGYSELSAFTRAFRGWTGRSPSRFRDSVKANGESVYSRANCA